MEQQRLFKFDQPLRDGDILWVFINQEFMTRREIAKALGCAKSPSLVRVLDRMVEDGFLTVGIKPLPNGVDMYVYNLTNAGEEEIWDRFGQGTLLVREE